MTSQSTAPDVRRRVIVCGGGVIGVCAAYYLSKKGAAVTVVEQSSVACAASGKAGGFLAIDWCDGGPLSELARTSFNLHRLLADDLDGARSYGYRALDTLSVVVTESGSGLGQKGKSRSAGLPEWVDGPAQNPKPIGTTDTTAQVHPGLFTRVVMEAAVEKYGAEVVVGKVERVVPEAEGSGGAATVVVEGGRVMEAEAVVLALGPWTGKIGMVGEDVFGVYGLKAHSIVLDPIQPNSITAHALFLSYYPVHGTRPIDPEVYPRPTGEVYICGMSLREDVPNNPEEVTPNPESISMLKRVAINVSTHLKEGEARVKAEQACFLPCTDDGIPVIGELPGARRCYIGTGHGCWGILNGPATGVALAELVLDGDASIVDLSPFSPARFVGAESKRL